MQQSATANKKAFNFFLGSLATISAYNCAYQLKRYYESREKWTKIYGDLSNFQPQEIKDFDALHYPWYRNNDLNKWEFQLVKLTGYFKEDRYFVRKEREGRSGYFVFAPFITAVQDYDPLKVNQNINLPSENGIMVNLGWVPLENKDDIQKSSDPLPLLESSQEELSEKNRYTGFVNNPENPTEEEVYQLTEVTGLIRAGEKENWLFGRRNWPKEGVYRYIDLGFMSRWSRLFNYDSASTAYIERMIEQYDEDSEGNYPIPATKQTFNKPLLMPNRHLQYATAFGGFSAITLVGLILNSLK